MSHYTVKSAVYGAFSSNPQPSQVANVTAALQAALDRSADGKVVVNNSSMGGDPSVGIDKHFGAVLNTGVGEQYYACGEGQTIDFSHAATSAAAGLKSVLGHLPA